MRRAKGGTWTSGCPVVTLGVADIGRARAFYEALGWRGESPDGAVFFECQGMVLALWGRERLAEDSVVVDAGAGAV
jgi:catechol 2,3-dioxygenase-like lactoylglutathione lyase family enzyme